MIILNTTFHVHLSVVDSFMEWVKVTYFPNALCYDGFSNPEFARILIEVQEGYASFAVQLSVTDVDTAVNWHDGEAAELRDMLWKKYGDKVLFFTTYMESLPTE